MAHGLAFWSGEASNVTNNWLGDVFLDVFRSVFLSVATDLTDHDDSFSLRIVLECLDSIDMGSTNNWVTTDTNARGESDVTQLVHHLVGQGTGFGNQADLAWVWSSLCWDDACIGLAWGDQTRAVWSDNAGLAALFRRSVEFRGVLDRNAFGNHNNKWHFCVDSFFSSCLGELRWNEKYGDVSSGLVLGVFDRTEDRDSLAAFEFHLFAGFLRVHTTNNVGSGIQHALGVLHTFRASHALNDDLRI